MEKDYLIQSDSLRGLGDLPDESVDLVFADPPFHGIDAVDSAGNPLSDDAYLEWSGKWIREVHRVLRPTGTFWLGIGDDFVAELKIIATKEVGFFLRNWVVWHYTYGTCCRKKFTPSHTHFLYFVKDAKNFTFEDDAIRVPSARQYIYGDLRANPAGVVPEDTWVLRPREIPGGFDGEQSVWYFADVNDNFRERTGWHGVQMPEPVLERILKSTSRVGDLVLDPFVGTGTTAVVAKKLGRHFIGFDLSEEYLAVAQKRLEATSPDDPVLGGFYPPKAMKWEALPKAEEISRPLFESETDSALVSEDYPERGGEDESEGRSGDGGDSGIEEETRDGSDV